MSEKDFDPNKDYSTEETGEILGISSRHVQRMIKSGHLPGARKKSPVPKSPFVVPGSAISEFIKKRELE